MNFPKLFWRILPNVWYLKILKKRKNRKTMPLFELLGLFLGYLFIYVYLFYLGWFGWVVKGMATDNCLISWRLSRFLKTRMSSIGFFFTPFDKFSHSPMQAFVCKLIRNCLAIDWALVNLFTIDKKVLN